ncbi:MAG: peptidylprolyl isomerase [Acidobacteriota bacterium]
MKRDAIIALIATAVTTAICYGLAIIKLDLKPNLSRPYTTAEVGQQVSGHVIMRINGEPVTEEEFGAAYAQLPEDMQRQLSSPQGKTAFAEQFVRYKLLEQEGRRLGVDRDPKVAGAIAADRTSILASAAAQKLVAVPTDQAVRDFYAGNKETFDSLQVAHILLAYAGGMGPSRPGRTAPSQAQAMARAKEIVKQLRAGANFSQAALQLSDDVATAERGGDLGTFGRGTLPPELEQHVFGMKEGEISDPMPSRFGVHIFRVGKRGTQAIEQVRPAIARRVQQQNTLDRIEVLRKQAKVDFDPKFFPDKAPRPTKKSS